MTRDETEFERNCRTLGYIVFILARIPARALWPLVTIKVWLEPPVLLRQCEVIFDRAERPCGYYTWAWLPNELHKALPAHDIPLLHISEWKEGEILTVMDFAAVGAYRWALARRILGSHLRAGQRVSYLRRNGEGKIISVTILSLCNGRVVRQSTFLQ